MKTDFSQSLTRNRSAGTFITSKVKEDLVQQLVKDGQISNVCVKGWDRKKEFIIVDMQELNQDDRPEYLVRLTNESIARCMNETKAELWCYQRTPSKFVLLLSEITANYTVDHFSKKKSVHRGFADLELVLVQGSFIESKDYIFDGIRYVSRKFQ